MDIDILDREEQALMGREEITVEISHSREATPSAAAVRDKISAELDLNPKTVEIAGIHSSTGLPTSTGTVRVHDEAIHDELPEAGDEAEGDSEEGSEEIEEDGDADSEAEAGEAVEEDGAEDEDADEEEPDADDKTEEEPAEEETDEDNNSEEQEGQ